MEKKYWIGRKRAAMAMARKATDAEARLIHYDMAGRYSVKAAQCLPFLLAGKAPATTGERAALGLFGPLHLRPRFIGPPDPDAGPGPGSAGPDEGR